MIINYAVEYSTRRCHACGRYWALEKDLAGTCPRCARVQQDGRDLRIQHLERVIRALRGALTRALKRGGA